MMGRDPETFTDKDVKVGDEFTQLTADHVTSVFRHVQESLRYLLPTRLFDRDARPFLKVHTVPVRVRLVTCLPRSPPAPNGDLPQENWCATEHKQCHVIDISFPSESLFDATTGRPLESAFYTGFPAYHNLIYQIFQHNRLLEEAGLPGPSQSPGELSQESGRRAELPGPDQSPGELSQESGKRDEEEGGGGGGAASVPKHWVKRDKLSNILAENISDQQVGKCPSLACVDP